MARLLPVALLCLLLAACGGGRGPDVRIFDGSSVPQGGQGTARTTGGSTTGGSTAGGSTNTAVAPPEDGVHTVRRGETLYAISRGYRVPLRTLIVENGLSPPYDLLVGQRVRIPAVRVHTVRAGETVYGISRHYGVAMNELVRLNRIPAPYRIQVGQGLSIPAGTGPVARQTVAVSPNAAQPSSSPSTSIPTPQPGTDPNAPSATPTQPAPTASDAPTAPSAPPAPPAPTPVEPDYGPNRVVYPVAKPTPPPRLVGPIPQPPALSGEGFLWPVQGSIVSGYGPKGRGLHNDGINIAAPRNSPIRASESGVVAYAGDGLQGFGNIVLIKHRDGYVTAYAHADTLLVTRGQVIQRGQAIARVGSTGSVDSPQVHFQIRRGRNAINPRTLLLTS